MAPVHSFRVFPALPDNLCKLNDLAYNLIWSWNHTVREVFRRADRDLWDQTGHNPVRLLALIDQHKIDELAADDSFLAHLERAWNAYRGYMEAETWYSRRGEDLNGLKIAYFSAEFGLTECMPIYSGGLGILSGDHVKSASDLGLPFIGVGLLYQQGYFRQYLTADGWQQETYPENDFYHMPVRRVRDAEGAPLKVRVQLPGRDATIQVWKVAVGRVRLVLLDTNLPENTPEDREITNQLYGGDREMRIKQEIVLGIGGLRALHAMGEDPTVCHMNEGHSAFMSLERIRLLCEKTGLEYAGVVEAARASNLFTTHTPVAAGFDLFGADLMDKYFTGYYQSLGLQRGEFLTQGQSLVKPGGPFNMAMLATSHSGYINAVSELHARVSCKMWQSSFPNVPEEEIPIRAVTNGVHTRSWLSIDMQRLFESYLGVRWLEKPEDNSVWEEVDRIPDEELWLTHVRRRERLVAFARDRLKESFRRRGAASHELKLADEVLRPNALTIGFARRFATYKRATLLLRDPERLKKILTDSERPVQIIFAGKAHPQDDAGKEFIRSIVRFARDDEVRRRVVFIEDYDISLARYMVQGVDIWLNTPRRPLEASGTSGMKVIANGGLNLSILDGWWDEAYQLDHEVGWAIGSGEEYEDQQYQDRIESENLYDLLEREVIPTFYSVGDDNLPRDWIRRIKASISKLAPFFNTNRMVQDYAEKYYLPAHRNHVRLSAENMAGSGALAEFRRRVFSGWKEISIKKVEGPSAAEFRVGGEFEVRAAIELGSFKPEEVAVELYYGPLNAEREISAPRIVPMHWSAEENGKNIFIGPVKCNFSGLAGYTVRVRPEHNLMEVIHQTGRLTWE